MPRRTDPGLRCGRRTTDFTLISLREVDGRPRFERLAVGDHLILGGDNMDLALARLVESRLSETGRSVPGDQWRSLTYQCRQIKEALLSGRSDSGKISLTGRGRRLIAGTISASLDRQGVHDVVLDTFFPEMTRSSETVPPQAMTADEFGLPYEKDPAVTHHLGRFLQRHGATVEKTLGKESAFPDLILFNGGSLEPKPIQDRIRRSLRQWFHRTESDLPRILENPRPDIAVSLGAAYYGLVKAGHGVRVGSGSARSFYLGVQRPGGQTDSNACQASAWWKEGRRRGPRSAWVTAISRFWPTSPWALKFSAPVIVPAINAVKSSMWMTP